MDDLQKYIHLSKYSRWIPEEKRRETWDETVDRLQDFWVSQKKLWPSEESVQWSGDHDIFEAIRNLEIMPSMRTMMTAGKALERDHAAGYNCWAIAVNHPRVFDEIFYLLMCGGGVGFSVEREYIKKLPEVSEEFHTSDTTIVVRDSKIGWASALKELVSMLYSGNVPSWDTSKVRAAGSPLKTFGGRASGPEPLRDLFRYTVNLFKKAKGRKLNSLECHDLICKIADTVIVGSVRRSACISLSNLTDDRMRRAKTGQWWLTNPERALANISTAYTEKPDLESYLKEFRSMYRSKAGERGIVNKKALESKALECDREHDGDYLLNPCFSGDSLVQTAEGLKKIKDITEETYVYSMDHDGSLCLKKCSPSWITREKAKTIRISLSNGENLVVTPDHKIYRLAPVKGKDAGKHEWVKAEDLEVGDHLNGIFRVRRGTKYSGVKLSTDRDYKMEHRVVYEGVYGNLRPDFDVHHIDGDTYNNSMHNLEALSHITHAALTRNSCSNNHQLHGERGNFRYQGGAKPKTIVPLPAELKNVTSGDRVYVTYISEGPEIPVYDITVEDTHNLLVCGIIAHNCGEAILRDTGQACNLTEVIVRPKDTLQDLKRKVEQATILGTLQSTLTDFRYIRSVWKKNIEEERLLGVSLTGIMDHPVLSGGGTCLTVLKRGFVIETEEDLEYVQSLYQGWKGTFPWKVGDAMPDTLEYHLVDVLGYLRRVAKETNAIWADKLGIPRAKQITLVKPSGTVSLLCDTSPGIHPRYHKHYIRRVTQDSKDPLTQLMIDEGVPYVVSGDKVLFEFPCKSPDHAVLAKDLDAIQQLELWKTYRTHWCDGNPSQSIYYTDDTLLKVQSWVWDHWDDIGGLSFFPKDDSIYENAPIEATDEQKYEQLIHSFPKEIQWDRLPEYETDDTTTGTQELSCSGGSCEIT